MSRKRWIPAYMFTIGLVVLILPDAGPSVVKLNEKHAPSWLDILGLTLMLAGWMVLSYWAITNAKLIVAKIGKTNARVLVALYCISIGGIMKALLAEIEWLLWISILVAASINVLLVITAFPRRAANN